jgi:hypothetical protein
MKIECGEKVKVDIINTIHDAMPLDRREFFVTSILIGAFALAPQQKLQKRFKKHGAA